MKFIIFKDANDGTDVYIRPDSINAVYIQEDKTVVCTNRQSIPVDSGIKYVVKKIEEAV